MIRWLFSNRACTRTKGRLGEILMPGIKDSLYQEAGGGESETLARDGSTEARLPICAICGVATVAVIGMLGGKCNL